MFDLGFLIFTAVIAAVVGFLLGIVLHRSAGGAAGKVRELNKALAEAEEKNGQYQHHVAEHFSQTAVMLNDLTEKYKDIHQHLATGADQLCRNDDGQSLLSNAPIAGAAAEATTGQSAQTREHLQPPLDYAPKSEADNVGTLAEDYGLEKIDLSKKTASGPTDPNESTGANNTTAANSDESDRIKPTPPNVRAV